MYETGLEDLLFFLFPKKSVVCCIISRKANKSAHKEGRKVFDLALLYLQTKTEESPDFFQVQEDYHACSVHYQVGLFFRKKIFKRNLWQNSVKIRLIP